MFKLVFILLASFSLLSAETNQGYYSYSSENSYHANDGTYIYKVEKVEMMAIDGGSTTSHQSSKNEYTAPEPDKRPLYERKDFVKDDSTPLQTLKINDSSSGIEWIAGKKDSDTTFVIINNQFYLMKKTTYLMAIKPTTTDQPQKSTFPNKFTV